MPKGICYNANRQERRKCSLWHAKSPGVATSGAFLFRCGKVAYALGWLTTSFLAVYLTFRRSPYFALAYAANDIVLIILWILASLYDIRYVSVVVCFIAFFANDIYGFVSWRKMKTRQQEITNVVSIM